MRGAWIVAAAALAACVPHPDAALVDEGSSRPITEAGFEPLDAGSSRAECLHFSVSAYGPDLARQTCDQAEASYNQVMVDTNLYSFKPKGLYRVVVYATEEEYRRKTGQPSWSGGVSVGNAIYAFAGPGLHRLVAHEMTHLIFHEFMDGRTAQEHRWINEGLAVYEETKVSGGRGAADPFSPAREALRRQPLPMEQLVHLVPARESRDKVDAWYAQAESMIRYMIERGGRLGFSQFLTALRGGRGTDEAVSSSFPGAWRNLADFELGWRRSLE